MLTGLLFWPGKVLLAETLGDVLAAHHVPFGGLLVEVQRQLITSYAASTSDAPFLLAYYDDEGSGQLTGKLHLLRYDPVSHRLQRSAFQGEGNLADGVMRVLPVMCLGSALSISEADGYIAVGTHVNPSAGCMLVLTNDLRFSAALWGWLTARVGARLLFTESMVHFAPTHSERFSLYDPRSGQLVPIYPASQDPARAAFSVELQAHVPKPQNCAGQNVACDPEDFTVNLDHVTVDASATSFSFAAHMSAEGFGEEAERLVPSKTVNYVCTLERGKWTLRTP